MNVDMTKERGNNMNTTNICINEDIRNKKVGTSVSGVCLYIAKGEATLDDFSIVIGSTKIEDKESAQEVCDFYSSFIWHFTTEEQEDELRKCRREDTEEYFAKLNELEELNAQKAQEAFWALLESGKLYQPKVEDKSKLGAPGSKGVFDSLEEFVTDVTKYHDFCNDEDHVAHDLHVIETVRTRLGLPNL